MNNNKTLVLALAADSPLYLPIYLAHADNFFELRHEFNIVLSAPSDPNENGDWWAARQVADRKADFAVCDPTIVERLSNVLVVGTLVNRAAFWAVARRDIATIAQFKDSDEIITYPKEMTASNLAVAIKKEVHPGLTITNVPVDSEFLDLDKSQRKVAITANFIKAREFTETFPAFRYSSHWTAHPSLSSFMLTGLLAHPDSTTRKYDIVAAFVSAITRACAVVRSDPARAGRILKQHFHRLLSQPSNFGEDNWEAMVRLLGEFRAYPVTPYPEPTSWHNAWELRTNKVLGLPRGANPLSSSDRYGDRFYDGAASAAENVILDLLTELTHVNQEVIDGLLRLSLLTNDEISRATVVGSYRRFDANARAYLLPWATRIKTALLEPSQELENYLIWGPSGEGKTFFAQEIARDLNLRPIVVDMREDRATVVNVLSKVVASENPTLVIVDEVDSSKSAAWGCDELYKHLEKRQQTRSALVFVLIGSLGSGVGGLENILVGREKGYDLNRRIAYRFDVPRYSLLEQALIIGSSSSEEARKDSKAVVEIEKFALYYLLVDPAFKRVAQRVYRVQTSIRNLDSAKPIVTFEDLFTFAEAVKCRESLVRHYSAFRELRNTSINVKAD